MTNGLLLKTLVSLFLLIGSISFSQNLEVAYKAKFIAVPDAEFLKGLSPTQLKRTMKLGQKVANSVEKQEIVLIATDSTFVLTVEEQMDLDIESMSLTVGRSA